MQEVESKNVIHIPGDTIDYDKRKRRKKKQQQPYRGILVS
jgi:hypothetical protein